VSEINSISLPCDKSKREGRDIDEVRLGGVSEMKSILNGSQTQPYRFGNSSLRFQTKYVLLLGLIIFLGFLYILLPTWSTNNGK